MELGVTTWVRHAGNNTKANHWSIRAHPIHCSEKARLRAKARRLESDMVAARVAHQKSQQQLEQAQQAVHDTQDAQERLATKLHDTSAQLQLVTKDFDATKCDTLLVDSIASCVVTHHIQSGARGIQA